MMFTAEDAKDAEATRLFSSFSLAASPNGRRAKQIQREIRVLFRACFGQGREETAGCPRVPFFASFLGTQERRNNLQVLV